MYNFVESLTHSTAFTVVVILLMVGGAGFIIFDIVSAIVRDKRFKKKHVRYYYCVCDFYENFCEYMTYDSYDQALSAARASTIYENEDTGKWLSSCIYVLDKVVSIDDIKKGGKL